MIEDDVKDRFERWQSESTRGLVVPPLARIGARARRRRRQRRALAAAMVAGLVVAAVAAGLVVQREVTAGPSPVVPAVSPTPPSPAPTGKSTSEGVRVPVPGWAGQVVPAGTTAYVTGWDSHGAAALWYAAASGRLSPRTPPPGMPGNPGLAGNSRIEQLVFDGPRTGLAITGRIGDNERGQLDVYATDDGARSWTPLDLPTREQPVRVAIGGGAGYVLTSNCMRAGAACDHATVWSIDPTGAHPAHSFDSLPAKTHTNGGITLAGYGTSIWVFLDMGTGESAAFHSVDGGRTWQRFPTELCLSETPTATSSSVLWSTCATGMLEHFTRQIGQSKPVQVFRADIAGTSNSAVLPISDTTAYAVIDDRHGTRVEATGDGGHTTSTVGSIPHPIMRRDFRTTFVSPEVGYLVTLNGGQLYRTTDGAHTWHKISPPTQ